MLRALAVGGSATLIMCAAAGSAAAQLTITVNARSAVVPTGTDVYVAGTFNGWNPAAPNYKLRRNPDGTRALTLPAEVRGPVEFKFTLGAWEKVETDSAGGDVPNRALTIPQHPITYAATIAAWKTGVSLPAKPTRTASVTILDTAFTIPQLGRTRRIWLYLPPDYAATTKRYPVLYMHDGQNLFDQATSFAGEWGIDETLDSLHAAGDAGVIVVGIDHGGTKRMVEYAPWPTRFGAGEGEAYVDFLVNTLKPFVDARYRTKVDRAHTGIGGSSMGGLISLYAMLTRPDVFGRAAVFSPALWLTPNAFELARTTAAPRPDQRIYFISGALEVAAGEAAGRYDKDQDRMVELLAHAGFRNGTHMASRIAPDGTHSEWFWRREFPAAYQWLFGARDPSTGR